MQLVGVLINLPQRGAVGGDYCIPSDAVVVDISCDAKSQSYGDGIRGDVSNGLFYSNKMLIKVPQKFSQKNTSGEARSDTDCGGSYSSVLRVDVPPSPHGLRGTGEVGAGRG